MKDAKTLRVIDQDIRNSGSVPIYRSRNQGNGIEMTWSCWIYIDDPTYNNNNSSYKPVFVKGSNTSNTSNTTSKYNQSNAPAYFYNLHIKMLLVKIVVYIIKLNY